MGCKYYNQILRERHTLAGPVDRLNMVESGSRNLVPLQNQKRDLTRAFATEYAL